MATRLGSGITAALFALLLFLPSTSQGTAVHAFDCKKCHIPSLSVSQLGGGNVCLSCHDETVSMPFNDDGSGYTTGTVLTAFTLADASNALGNNSSPASLAQFALGRGQTSHNWAAPDTQPRAGAVAPDAAQYRQFYSRYGSSTGRVTCSRCHNPHASRANPQLLILGAGSAQQMCLACHAPWNQQGTDKTNITHPVGIDYIAATAAHAGSYNTAVLPDDGNLHTPGSVSLFGGKIMCGSCHQAHFADSNAAIADTPENFENLSMGGGDGKLLRGNGAGRANNSSLCQTCHTYRAHGADTGEQVGCLVCHGGHANDPLARNYFMLRKSAATTTYNTVDGLDYSMAEVLELAQKFTYWNDQIDGLAEGYCEKCHGDAKNIGVGKGRYHVKEAVCTDCHKHGQENGSFGASCTACHGMPPTVNTLGGPGGLVNKPAATGSATAGAHTAHSVAKPYLCDYCHANSAGSGPKHISPSPQTVTLGFSMFNGAFQGGTYNGQAGVVYDATTTTPPTTVSRSGAMTCTNTYCHGNYPGSGKNAIPVWNAANSVVCGSCHGASGSAPPASGDHAAHAGSYKIPCTSCHGGIVSGSEPYTIANQQKHVDGKVDWSFNAVDSRLRGGSERYNIASGTAQPSNGTTPHAYSTCENLYCHSTVQSGSDGTGPPVYGKPTWGTNSSCSGCHAGTNYHNSSSVAADGSRWLNSGSHKDHLAYAFDIAGTTDTARCVTCHAWDARPGTGGCGRCHSAIGNVELFAKHANGKIDIAFHPAFTGGSYNGSGVPRSGFNSCSNTYCHSDGTSVATGTIPANISPRWGSGNMACTGCHGFPPAYGNGSPKANSHGRHNYGCNTCHYTVTSNGTTITENGAWGITNHVSKSYTVSPGAGVTFTYSYNASGGTCTSISCHNNGSGTWGTNTPCSSCHSDIKSIHIATPETGRVAMHDGGSFSVNCTSCHSLSLLAIHANDCDLCHENTEASVNSAIASWDGKCGACHQSNHLATNSKAAIGHAPYGYNKCTGLCHANGYAYSSAQKSHIRNCFICHVSSIGPNPSAPPTWDRASNGKLLLVQTFEGRSASNQQFVTPTGVTALTIDAYGATGSEGGDRTYAWIPNAGAGGLGGRVLAELPVTPLQVLTLRVGRSGGRYKDYTSTWRSPAGWPNGGSGADPTFSTGGGSGGGSTSVLSGSTVLIEAGGGAGGAYVPYGGNADGKVGGAGGAIADSGPGGNQTGGAGTSFGGGGGGGGWTGGAGGAAGLGGNGGTSYLGSLAGTITPGVKNGDGLLNINWIDDLAPTTTSDSVTSYSGAGGTITLTATDSGGAGVAATRYSLDGGEEVTGTSVNFPGTTVDIVHTLAFYSIDNAGNPEAENVVTFTVFGDPLAPITTSDVKMTRYWCEAVISLTATDPGGSGVASTHFRLDGGAESTGSTVIVAPPATGMETHSLEFWSVDRTGNIEASHLVTFEISPTDIIPPTTTSDAMSSYPLSATINLSASDAVSGVASTRYRLDAGVESAGTMVFTSVKGEHSLEYWSVDNAGNIETHKTVTFGVGLSTSVTYNYSGTEQLFTVPAGVTAIIVDLYGAQGGQGGQAAGLGAVGGQGGKVHAQIPVTPGTKLTVVVGGQGRLYGPGNNQRGYQNGLGALTYYGSGGGGSSFISLGSVTNYGDDTSGLVLAEAGAGSGGNGTTQGLPGGNQGAGVRHQWHGDWLSPGHGGGWNHGETVGAVSGGGTSFIATGTGTLTTGVRQGNGEVSITWFE